MESFTWREKKAVENVTLCWFINSHMVKYEKYDLLCLAYHFKTHL